MIILRIRVQISAAPLVVPHIYLKEKCNCKNTTLTLKRVFSKKKKKKKILFSNVFRMFLSPCFFFFLKKTCGPCYFSVIDIRICDYFSVTNIILAIEKSHIHKYNICISEFSLEIDTKN